MTSSPLAGTAVEFDLTVTPAAGAPYEATVKQYMVAGAMQAFAAGSEVTVKIDPGDPMNVLIWGGSDVSASPQGSGGGSEGGRIERLEKLSALRMAGAITEDEFQQEKARILADS